MPPRYLQVKLTDGKDAVVIADEPDAQGDLFSWFGRQKPERLLKTPTGYIFRGTIASAVREINAVERETTPPPSPRAEPSSPTFIRRLLSILAVFVFQVLPATDAVLHIATTLTGSRRDVAQSLVRPTRLPAPGALQTEEEKRRLEEERRRFAPYFGPGLAPRLGGADYVAVADLGLWGQTHAQYQTQSLANVVAVASIDGNEVVPLPGTENWKGWSRAYTPTTVDTNAWDPTVLVGGTTLPGGGATLPVEDPTAWAQSSPWVQTSLLAWELSRRQAKVGLLAFNTWAQAEPDNALPWLGKAVVQEQLGRRADAEKAYERAVEAVPALRPTVEALKMNPYSPTAREIVYGAQVALQEEHSTRPEDLTMATEGSNTSDQGFVETSRRHLTALAHVEGLLMLDDLWTSYLSLSDEQPADVTPDFEGLRQLAADMDGSLAGAAETAKHVRITLKDMTDEAVAQGLAMLRESQPEKQVFDWLNRGSEDGPPRAMLISACLWVEEQTGNEREILFAKAQRLDSGELPDPDLRPIFRCLWTMVGIGAGVALAGAGAAATLGAFPTVGLGVVTSAFTLSTGWKKSGCADTLRMTKAVLATY